MVTCIYVTMSARSWVYTINNYTLDEQLATEGIPCRYHIYGLETGENGTPHMQGYIEFGKVYRFAGVKKLLPRAHLEIRKGTRDEARAYCMKDNEYIEVGDWDLGGQGRRTDLNNIRQIALEGGMRAVTTIAGIQGIRTAEKFLTYNEDPRDWKPEVHWLWGKTGVGKSRTARELTGDEDTYTKNDGTKWWEGYDGHENVIMDDFRDSWWSITETLSLLDRYEKRVEYKGDLRQFRPKKIVITSLFPPGEQYKNTGECINQLIRRIDHVTEIRNDDERVILEPLIDI